LGIFLLKEDNVLGSNPMWSKTRGKHQIQKIWVFKRFFMEIPDDLIGLAIELVIAIVILGIGFFEIIPAILSA